MKKKAPYFRKASLALTVSAVLCFSVSAVAGEQVPFKGHMEGIIFFTPLSPTELAGESIITGGVTHLGRATVIARHVLVIVGGIPGPIVDGVATFTAANGDTVTGVYSGTNFPPDASGVFSFVGTLIVTGGTGRFVGATGSADFVGIGILAPDLSGTTFTFSLDGTISSPGANK